MNLPSTTLGSNPVAFSSIARTSTSVTPRCSIRNSAWLVNERSQFHHSGKVGMKAYRGAMVAPNHGVQDQPLAPFCASALRAFVLVPGWHVLAELLTPRGEPRQRAVVGAVR